MKKKLLILTLFALVCVVAVSFSNNVKAATLESLNDKFEKSGENPTVYKLKDNIELSDQIAVDQGNIVIDLNGHTIKSNLNKTAILIGSENNSANVTITGNGKILSSKYIAVHIKNGTTTLKNVEIDATPNGNKTTVQVGSAAGTAGHLIVEQGTVINNKKSVGSPDPAAIGVFGTGSTLEVNGGNITSDSYAITGSYGITNNSVITIKGGKITSTGSTAIYHPQTGTLTISGGEVTGLIGIVARQGEINIKGGKITANGTKGEYIKGIGIDTPLPSGVSVIVDNASESYENTSKVNINGGEFNATADNSLFSYTKDGNENKDDFEVGGGKYNVPFNSEFIDEGKLEVGISKGEGTDTTYYIGADAVEAVKEAAKNGDAVVEVFQGDLEIKGAADGFTLKNSGNGKVTVNGTSVTKDDDVVVKNPEKNVKDNTPKTGMIDYTIYISLIVAVVALGGIYTVKKLVK